MSDNCYDAPERSSPKRSASALARHKARRFWRIGESKKLRKLYPSISGRERFRMTAGMAMPTPPQQER